MLAHNRSWWMILALALSLLPAAPSCAWAYVGPGPGMEFIPYFMSLLMWAGAALGGALLWPIVSLIRRIRGHRTTTQELAANVASPSGVSRHHGA